MCQAEVETDDLHSTPLCKICGRTPAHPWVSQWFLCFSFFSVFLRANHSFLFFPFCFFFFPFCFFTYNTKPPISLSEHMCCRVCWFNWLITDQEKNVCTLPTNKPGKRANKPTKRTSIPTKQTNKPAKRMTKQTKGTNKPNETNKRAKREPLCVSLCSSRSLPVSPCFLSFKQAIKQTN